MNRFDVSVNAIRRRGGRRRPFEVRWRAAGRTRSKSFITRALADSYRAELVRAARKGLEFDPQTGEPMLWAEPEPVTWYQHAAAYAAMKWPTLAAHSRASVAEALATVTPALTRAASARPPSAQLRTALYKHAFNPARTAAADPVTTRVLAWAQHASLPVARLADPLVLRAALDALTLRLDGSRAAANTITRKRAVFHGALGYAVEAGLLDSNPADSIRWQVPKAATAVDPKVVASPAQAEALLAAVARIRPALAAFFGCLYYGALRPEEAIALRLADCHLPARGWGMLTLTRTAPRTAAAWTGNGTSHEQRGLKHRPEGSVRTVPIPPVLVSMLRHHHRCYGTTPDGRLFRGTRGGPLSESSYGRTWHAARTLALGPAATATALARRPYDLRHAALSLWLNAGAAPAQIAQRAGHSITMLLAVYTHCIDGQADITNRQIEHALHTGSQAHCVTASGSANRRYHPDPVRHMSVHGPHSRARTADCQPRAAAARTPRYDHRLPFPQLRAHPGASSGHHERAAGPAGSGPRMAHNASKRSAEPLVFSVRAADTTRRQRL
jgi:integrase